MNKLFTSTLSVFFCLTLSINLMAQDDGNDAHNVTINVPEVAILDIEPAASTAITLAPEKPTEAGLALDFTNATNDELWLNYSSIIGSTTESSRNISVVIQSGTVPGGMVLKVTADVDAGNGDGTVGTSAGEITLSGSAQNIITGIGSCYTGHPENNGHQLTYVLELDAGNYSALDFDDSNVLSIVYTISDN